MNTATNKVVSLSEAIDRYVAQLEAEAKTE